MATPTNNQSNGHPRRPVLPPVGPAAPPPEAAQPALLQHAEHRAEDAQNRLADAITGFAGSMIFVYIHLVWFGCWIGFGVESYPFGLLTMIVSLEAIFLSTFVLVSQNRADAKRQVIADQQWATVQGRNSKTRSCSVSPDRSSIWRRRSVTSPASPSRTTRAVPRGVRVESDLDDVCAGEARF